MQKEKTLTFQNAKKLKGRQKVLNDLGEKSFQQENRHKGNDVQVC